MESVVVTVVGPQRSVDVAVPATVPVRELIPDLVDVCTDARSRSAGSRWAVGVLGDQPFAPQRSLGDSGVVDGTTLFLRDMTSPVPPPAPATPPPPPVVRRPAIPGAPESAAGAAPAFRGAVDAMGRPLNTGITAQERVYARFGWDPSPSTAVYLLILSVGVSATLAAAFASHGLSAVGVAAAAVSAVVALAAVWWAGLFMVAGSRGRLGILGKLPAPPGLSASPVQAADQASLRAGLERDRATRTARLVESFLYDLGRLFAGHSPDLTYMEPAVAQSLRQMVAPLLATGDRITPRFGTPRVRILPVGPGQRGLIVEVVFEDSSTRLSAAGHPMVQPRRQVTAQLTLDEAITRVLRAGFASSPLQ